MSLLTVGSQIAWTPPSTRATPGGRGRQIQGSSANARAKSDDVHRIASQDATKEAIAQVAGISVASVYRLLATSKRAA
jgi:hypothetical protein